MRLSLAVLAACTALAVVAPAHAAGLSGMGANLFGNYFSFRQSRTSPSRRSGRITAGPLRMELQHTQASATLRKAFGGTIQHAGRAARSPRWLCYHTDGSDGPAANTWFISNALGGGEFVMIVAVQAADPKRIPADCDAAPAKFALPDLGIPGLGATTGRSQGGVRRGLGQQARLPRRRARPPMRSARRSTRNISATSSAAAR